MPSRSYDYYFTPPAGTPTSVGTGSMGSAQRLADIAQMQQDRLAIEQAQRTNLGAAHDATQMARAQQLATPEGQAMQRSLIGLGLTMPQAYRRSYPDLTP